VAPVDPGEPQRVADTVARLGLQFAVVTSVTRDDLPDGGAAHFAATVTAVAKRVPGCGVEVLVPDFGGDRTALETLLAAKPTVLNHNLETVPRLYAALRPQAGYERSLRLLRRARRWADLHHRKPTVKTGIMVGAGETRDEIVALFTDAVACGVEVMTVGQYLQPSRRHHPVVRFYAPEEFAELADVGRQRGLAWVEAGPLVRSSYHARQQSEALGKARATGARASGPEPQSPRA
jgi:lipoic acid synthetase